MQRISSKNKSIIESLSLYIRNHNNNAPELISKLAEDLNNVDFKETLIEVDKQLLLELLKASLTYCVATYTLYQYPRFIKTNAILILSHLINGGIKFNQRAPLAPYMNQLINELRNMLPTNHEKIETLLEMFNFEFNANHYYECAIQIHNQKLEEINNAQS